ncbi:hypothetical protein M569_11330, partial [Genlisea aurea]
ADGEEKVLATAQRIVQSLGNTSDAEDMLSILTAFDNRLSGLSSFVTTAENQSSTSVDQSPPLDPRLVSAERIILDDADSSSISGDYLAAIDDIIHFTEGLSLGGSADGVNDTVNESFDRADNALQLAMARLEDEFRHILIRNTVPLDLERLHRPFVSTSASAIPMAGTDYFTDEANESPKEVSIYSRHNRGGGLSFSADEMSLELIHPDAINELGEIADRMIRAGYEKECCQVYCSVRRDVLDECMATIGIEKISIEEVQRIEWESLDDKMRRWTHAAKIVVRGLLMSEKRLCEFIFSGSDLIKEVCFIEASKGCVMQLLNFGEAVAIGKRSPEKLFRILYMYDVLAQILPDIQTLFMDEDAGHMVCTEAKGVLDGLGEAAIGTLVEFENAVQGETSKKPTHNGEIHPLARYVMNYLKLLADSANTLNSLLEKVETEAHHVGNINSDSDLEAVSPVARRLLALITSLESNIEEKATMYEDGAMQYIFLMNNILYVVQKVKDSELRTLLGDDWIRKRRGLIRQYATRYLRAAWSQAVSFLKVETGSSSSNVSKVALKEKFKSFNACFEEIYRVQTAWKVPDQQLREELKISISEKVIPAYRYFHRGFGSQLESGKHAAKYIKYTPEELETHLLDLFEGAPLVLHLGRRKS